MFKFLSRRAAPFTRVLLVESGSRAIAEKALVSFYERHHAATVDLLTCFEGAPATFRAQQGQIYTSRQSRRQLLRDLRARHYDVLAMICSGEPFLAKYKIGLAALLPAKVLIVNENADYFWCDRGSIGILWKLFTARAGLGEESGNRTLTRIATFPFLLIFLVGFALRVHLMRRLRLLFRSAVPLNL